MIIILIIWLLLSLIITELNEHIDRKLESIYKAKGAVICLLSFFIVPYFITLLQISSYVRHISCR